MEHLSPWEWITIVACTLGGLLALVASFVIRFSSEDSDQSESSKAQYRFPPKEDKYARRNRWARVIGRGAASLKSLAHLQKLPVAVDPSKVSTEQVISFFLTLERQQHQRRLARAVQLAVVPLGAPGGCRVAGQAVAGPPGDSNSGVSAQQVAKHVSRKGAHSETEEFSFWGLWRSVNPGETAGFIPLAEMFPGPPTPGEIQRIKWRILRVLIEAGPAKSLCPIREAHFEGETDLEASWKQHERADLEMADLTLGTPAGRSLPATLLGWVGLSASGEGSLGPYSRVVPLVESAEAGDEAAAPGSVGPVRREPVAQRQVAGCQPLDLDLEPVIMMGLAGVSREMLWLALAQLGGKTYREEAEAEVREQWRWKAAARGV